MSKFLKITLLITLLLALGASYYYFYVPFSDEGVKAGVLNNIKHKGFIFKTYEGELIQTGFRPGQTGLQSNEFQFSIEDEAIAKRLMNMSGKQVELLYKEYHGKLPWRGYSNFVVDSIINVTTIVPTMSTPPME